MLPKSRRVMSPTRRTNTAPSRRFKPSAATTSPPGRILLRRPHDAREEGEEGGPRLQLEERDVGRDVVRVAVAGHLVVPGAVPGVEDVEDGPCPRGGTGLLRRAHGAGPGDDGGAGEHVGHGGPDERPRPRVGRGGLGRRLGRLRVLLDRGDGHASVCLPHAAATTTVWGTDRTTVPPDPSALTGRRRAEGPTSRCDPAPRLGHQRAMGWMRWRGPRLGADQPASRRALMTRPRWPV